MSVPNSFMPVPLHWQTTHFTGVTAAGEGFVYCPVGNIISWSEGDHKHRWCHYCKMGISEAEAKQIVEEVRSGK